MESKSSSYSEAFKKFSDWIEANEKRLNSVCHCCPNQPNNTSTTNNLDTNCVNGVQSRAHSWNHVIIYHQNLQTEVEEFGNQLNFDIKRLLNEDKTCTEEHKDETTKLEGRWHNLWLNSLEQLVIVERTRRCPKHNSTIIGKSNPPSTNNKSLAKQQRIRPISYPSVQYGTALAWDYQFTLNLTGCHKENVSQVDLDSVDEQETKDLTEFGDDYEVWFCQEDEVSSVPMHSRPPSVEPSEKPEIAKAVVTSNANNHHEDVSCNLLMLTTPSSMFSVDASKCSHIKKHNYPWRFVGLLLAIILLVFSALYHEPHHVHMSYTHTQPPV